MPFIGIRLGIPGSPQGAGGGSAPSPPLTLVAGTGVFTISGDSMTPSVTYTLSAGAGAFALAGQNATFNGPVPGKILLVDGTSFLLLADGASKLIKAA